MLTAIHPFSEEEIMAYVDGELPSERAVAAAQHLEQCRECQSLAAGLRSLSQQFAKWSVEPTTAALPRTEAGEPEQRKRTGWRWPRFSAARAAAAVLLVLVLGWLLRGPRLAERSAMPEADFAQYDGFDVRREPSVRKQLMLPAESAGAPAGAHQGPAPIGPSIIRTAQLSLVSSHFDRSRGDVEQIARAHQGYIAQLELAAPAGAGRLLNATLRVPASQLDAVLEELKRLGRVSSESQRGEDVTQRYVDVNARLSNLRITEERLLQILRDRAGKLADVLQVEEAIDRTRGEIETTEAEQKMLSNQIALGSVQLSVSELYESKLQPADASTLIRLRNAAVKGIRGAGEGVIAALAFLLAAGPSLLIVAVIGFFPFRWWWRRRRGTVG